MPSINDINITPGSGEITFNSTPTGNSVSSGTSTTGTVSNSDTVTSNYNISPTSSQNSFVNLIDGPGRIVDNAFLFGSGSSLLWSPVPTAANEVLVWTGSSFQWQTFTQSSGNSNGIQFIATSFTETSGTFFVATLTNATVVSAKVIIKTAFGSTSTIDVGSPGATNSIITSSNVESAQTGVYSESLYVPYTSATPISIIVDALGGSAGVGTFILEYIYGTV
jgi:hypothetical protein